MTGPDNLPRALLGAFREGLVQPRLSALAGALGVLAWCVLSVTPARLARLDRGYVLLSDADTAAEASLAVHRLAAAPPSDHALVVLGSSPYREGLGTNAAVSTELTRALGRPVDYTGLYLGHATLLEVGAMADALPPGLRGTVLVEVSLIRLTTDIAERARESARSPWLAVDSPVLDAEVQALGVDPGLRTGIHLLDHLPYFSARHHVFWRWLFHAPLALPPEMRLDDRRARDVPAIARMILEDERNMEADYPRLAEQNLELLGRIVALLRARGFRVALLESTMSPTRRGRLAKLLARYRARLDVFCRDHQVPYLDLTQDAALVQSDFYDAVHIWGSAARRRLQTAFVTHAARFLGGR